TSVSTWIARIDLALEGARISGRGNWTDSQLYYVLGNRLQDQAARWWVQLDQELRGRERTWTRLKSSLLRRYGERPDRSMAEWRVSQRPMLPGETYADFAASLRDLCGINRVSERVLLAQFYRSLDKTTRMLVKQKPIPRTLEQAVDKATEISDPIDNVAQGMENIGQAFVTAPGTYMVPAEGTTGQMMMIPGVGGIEATEGKPANFPHPKGAYNKFTGLWEAPNGMKYNGSKWVSISRKREDGSTTAAVWYAVSAQVDEETTARDSERAARYVETVKPAMATQRYMHNGDMSNDGSERHGVGRATDQTTDTSVPQTASVASAGVAGQRMDDESTSEEGERMAVFVSRGEEGETDDSNNALVTTATSDEVRMVDTGESTDEVDMSTVSIPDTAGETTMAVRLNDGAVRIATAVANYGSLSAVDHGLVVASTDGTHGASDEQVTSEGRIGDVLINDAVPSAISTANAVDGSLGNVDGAVSFDGVRLTSVDAGMACQRWRVYRQRRSRMEGGERGRREIQQRDGVHGSVNTHDSTHKRHRRPP
ncbi:hypothetical protein PHMEG_00033286, partial [Phytophthora megakarya]